LAQTSVNFDFTDNPHGRQTAVAQLFPQVFFLSLSPPFLITYSRLPKHSPVASSSLLDFCYMQHLKVIAASGTS
jgi:hypothetical protein